MYSFRIVARSAIFANVVSLNSTCVPWIEVDRCLETVKAVMLGSVESLMTRRLVVVDAIPNVRRDCAICGSPVVRFAYTVL